MKNIIQSAANRIIKIRYVKSAKIKLGAPVISFTFDDAPGSAFENGGAVLSKYGFNGTYYIALSLLSDRNPEGCFTKSHLEQCLTAGNELACHTFNHINFYKADYKVIEEDLDRNATELSKLFPDQRFKNFSYPFGEQTLGGKKLARDRFRSARGITPGINLGKTDLNSLKAIQLYEDINTLEFIYQQIAEVKRSNGWLIFYTHDVQSDYSAYGCSRHYFESVVKACSEVKIDVMTVDRALSLIKNIQE